MATEEKFTFKPSKGWTRETGTPDEVAFMDARKAKAEATRAKTLELKKAGEYVSKKKQKENEENIVSSKPAVTAEKFLDLIFKPEALPVILPLLKTSLVNNWFKIAQDILGGNSAVDKLQLEYFKQILKNIEFYEKNLQDIIAPEPAE